MLPYRDSRLTKIALIVFFVAIIAYAFYESRGMLYGPRIHVESSLTTVSDPYVVISGTADRIASLTMNGQPIAVTEDGAFEEPLLLVPGLNRIYLDAKDRYGRESQEIIEIVYTEENPDSRVMSSVPATTTASTPLEATTTPATSTAPTTP